MVLCGSGDLSLHVSLNYRYTHLNGNLGKDTLIALAAVVLDSGLDGVLSKERAVD